MSMRRLTDRVLDLDTLTVLDRIVAAGSLSRAAAEIGITQQAVSARLRTAERMLGVELVVRSPGGSRLTAAGRVVWELAAPVLAAAERLEAGARALREPEGAVVVGASQTIAELLLPDWLLHLRAERPDVRVRLRAGNSTDVLRWVRAGDVSLGFVEGPERIDDLRVQPIADDDLVVVVARDHPWAERDAVDAAELAATPLVVREPGSGMRAALEEWLHHAGHALAEPAAELGTTSAILATARTVAAPAVVGGRVAEHDLRSGELVSVPVEPSIARTLRAVWRGELSAAARTVLALAVG